MPPKKDFSEDKEELKEAPMDQMKMMSAEPQQMQADSQPMSGMAMMSA